MSNVAIPPFLWSDSGDFDSPVGYKVPGSGEVQPYTATATYTNNSGGDILPALRIKSASGNLLALTFPVGGTIANGAASEVTFVPPFGSAGGSSSPAPATIAEYAYARFTANQIVTSGLELVLATATFGTNSATRFTQGTNGIVCTGAGLYFQGALVDWQAGNYPKQTYLSCDNMLSFPYQIATGTAISEFADGAIAVNPVAAGNPTIHFTQIIVNSTASFNARARAFQNTGVNKTICNPGFGAPLYSQCLFVYFLGPTA